MVRPSPRPVSLNARLGPCPVAGTSISSCASASSSTSVICRSLPSDQAGLGKPLAGLTLQLVASRRGHAAIGDKGASPWLFPSGQPGRPISSYQLGQRVRQLGLQPGQARSTALFQLATDLPAAVLAKMLGIHISVAVAWQRASSGDWAAYAADISRRHRGSIPN